MFFFSSFNKFGKRPPVSRKPEVATNCLTEEPHVNDSSSSRDPYEFGKETVVLKVLNALIYVSGTQFIFFFLVAILIVWLVIGIIYKAPENWQVVMQDGQSIQCYIWDTLLMRQQLLETESHLHFCAESRSRLATYRRLLEKMIQKPGFKRNVVNLDIQRQEKHDGIKKDENLAPESTRCLDEIELPAENLFDITSNFVSKIIGSLTSVILYWVGIFIWIACGSLTLNSGDSAPYTGVSTGSNPKYAKWSNNWQLYINTAVAVEILITSIFLQNIRTRHERFIKRCMIVNSEVERDIEVLLRVKNDNDKQDNVTMISEREKRDRTQKCIDYYADIIGTGIGVAITVIVFAVWVGIGNIMQWSSNWWLIIGTYTGLVGFFDGFVLREVYYRITNHEESNYQLLLDEYQSLMQCLNLPLVSPPLVSEFYSTSTYSLWNFKISKWINKLSSSKYSVILSLIIILGLIAASSAMKWSTTGQLIANTPTMIIEGFFLIILCQAHNWADFRRRLEYKNLSQMQNSLFQYLQRIN